MISQCMKIPENESFFQKWDFLSDFQNIVLFMAQKQLINLAVLCTHDVSEISMYAWE